MENSDMNSLENIESLLKTVYEKYNNIRLGIAGSYANNAQHEESDIDIVVDGDSMQVDIMYYIKNLFHTNGDNVDVLWLDLMKQEDEELDKLAIENDLPINEYSAYKTVMQEVKWV